ncbi:MAG: hypothetical protein SFV24_17820 [Gemmatimonadales bacterium]|nr:hypothetical protein [Gemmatimonadales bacterium]
MRLKALKFASLTLLTITIAGCGNLETARHKYTMRGQILETQGDLAYICIGSDDGAQVGQNFTVYQFERQPSLHRGINFYKRKKTGSGTIVEVYDEHMATAEITNGEAKAHYVVELNP